MKLLHAAVVLMISLLFTHIAFAQEAATVIVPDLTGVNVPQAAAQLNALGLRLGTETAFGWTAEFGLPQNAISGQSVAPGTSVAAGSAVDVTVLRSANAMLLYDDNDITLVNNTGGTIDLTRITFNSVGGTSTATFQPARWSPTLEAGDCGQLWSVARTAPKDVPECPNSMLWLTTNDSSQHFWTGVNGAAQFNMIQDGIQRAVCPVSTTGRCEFYLAGGASSEVTAFVYFAYTTEQFLILNTTTDQWMPLAGLSLYDAAGNLSTPSSPAVFTSEVATFNSSVANVENLAPGQCLHFQNNTRAAPPQACTVIGEIMVAIDPATLPWSQPFTVVSLTDGQQRTCPGATGGRLTVCILPR